MLEDEKDAWTSFVQCSVLMVNPIVSQRILSKSQKPFLDLSTFSPPFYKPVLDLHGETLDGAYKRLYSFLNHSHKKAIKYVEVITGGGQKESGGAIRREFLLWMSEKPFLQFVKKFEPKSLEQGKMRRDKINPGSFIIYLNPKSNIQG